MQLPCFVQHHLVDFLARCGLDGCGPFVAGTDLGHGQAPENWIVLLSVKPQKKIYGVCKFY